MRAHTTAEQDRRMPLLAGVVGSTEHGLDSPASDVDSLGIFAALTAAFHGIDAPQETYVTTGPDATWHEARKWCRLALDGDPTALELLWLPPEFYRTRTALGNELIGIREAFLSATTVRRAYLQRATDEHQTIISRRDNPLSSDTPEQTAKRARRMLRLCDQGAELYATGTLTIRVREPRLYREFGEQVAAGDNGPLHAALTSMSKRINASKTPLPAGPDRAAANRWLLKVRDERMPAVRRIAS